MDRIRELSKKTHLQKDKRNTLISKKLNNEIRATQKLLSFIYKKRYKRKKAFTRSQASDFLAEQYRRQRYRLANEYK